MSRYLQSTVAAALVAFTASTASAQDVTAPAVDRHRSNEAAPPSHNPFNRPAFTLALRSAGTPFAAPLPAMLALRATLVAEGLTLANIDGEILAVGETYAGYRVAAISEGQAVLVKDGERLILDVYVRQTTSDVTNDE